MTRHAKQRRTDPYDEFRAVAEPSVTPYSSTSHSPELDVSVFCSAWKHKYLQPWLVDGYECAGDECLLAFRPPDIARGRARRQIQEFFDDEGNDLVTEEP